MYGGTVDLAEVVLIDIENPQIIEPNLGVDSTLKQVVILELINQPLENTQDTILSQVEIVIVEFILVVQIGDNFFHHNQVQEPSSSSSWDTTPRVLHSNSLRNVRP